MTEDKTTLQATIHSAISENSSMLRCCIGDTASVAACVSTILNCVFVRYDYSCLVEAPPYPNSTKIPLVITLHNGNQRLFWFYPQKTEDALTQDLVELVSDMLTEYIRIPA